MKTNHLTPDKKNVLLALIALTFFPFISSAQLFVNTSNNIGIGVSTPVASLDIPSGNYALGTTPTLTMGCNIGVKVTRTNSVRKLSSITQYPYTNANATYMLLGGDSDNGYNGIDIGGGFNGYNAATQVLFFTANTTNTKSGTERMRIDLNGNVGINTIPGGSYRLEVSGNSIFYGSGTYSASWTQSDQMFKTNIDSLQDALTIIDQLKPKSYYYDTLNFNEFNFSTKKQYGLIAQDVQQVLPELVTSTTKPADVDTLGTVIHPAVTYKSLNYNAFISIMLQGIKEQSSKIDSLSEGLLTEKTKTNNQDSIINSLQNQLNVLASTINSCCNDNHDNGNQNEHREAISNLTNVELNDAQTIVLEQNVPNPFAEQTAISYSLPDNTVKAQMLFYNAQGKLIQSTELTQKGKGTLNVFASDLSSGIYTYTLIVDGKIIETKKMVKQ